MDHSRRVGAAYIDSDTNQSANNTPIPAPYNPRHFYLFDDSTSDGSVFESLDFYDLFDTNFSPSNDIPLGDQSDRPGTYGTPHFAEQQSDETAWLETSLDSHQSFEPHRASIPPISTIEIPAVTTATQPEAVPEVSEGISLEELRPVIERLYKEKTLKEVVEILHADYENIPSLRTIKRKLGIWGIQKYKVKKGPVVTRKAAK